ncbi:MAG: DNA-3-methyladenine glycosylase I, partial [Hyphomicrobiales bacterium]
AGVPISDKGTSKKDQKLAQAQINAWAHESGLPLTHISRICALSIGENHDAARLAETMRT